MDLSLITRQRSSRIELGATHSGSAGIFLLFCGLVRLLDGLDACLRRSNEIIQIRQSLAFQVISSSSA
jgi:hypothetical protein